MSPSALFRYRLVLGFFIAGVILSGLTALPLQTELGILARMLGISDASAYANMGGLPHWIAFVQYGLDQTYSHFPFFGYATDWLAFGHFVIALFFFLPMADPIRYRGVLNVGLMACLGVIVTALTCGPIRSIPFYWSLIDCSFGVVGAVPLLYCLRLSRRLA